MIIQIKSEQFQSLFRHAEKTYPEECCGIILGEIEGDRKVILDLIPTQNAWNEEDSKYLQEIANIADRSGEKARNFSIAPEDLLKAQKEARDRHIIVLGFYHSHPDAAAIPSEFDRAIAWSDYSYLIIAVSQGKANDVQSWTLDRQQQFQSEIIQ
ncbi:MULTISPECIES: M67 family metallopeptidase [Spirulina sp. CCY15215]|uniref:M67 family metallopeptidase n=1 Tax=Spirulina sp. CCY15215 TaxID=2767591 RepID=UPI00194E8BDC|nr:M67 family metallopeptidase [Spirulina major]